jgi:hypothetical protein
MSLFLRGDQLHIVQLQGASSIGMPKNLADWAERFVKACMEFARRENLRTVWLAKADSLYSYHNPDTRWYLPPAERMQSLTTIRAGFEKHYDETGRALGFVPGINWFSWDNPDFRPLSKIKV